jgi:hypothetical protein
MAEPPNFPVFSGCGFPDTVLRRGVEGFDLRFILLYVHVAQIAQTSLHLGEFPQSGPARPAQGGSDRIPPADPVIHSGEFDNSRQDAIV